MVRYLDVDVGSTAYGLMGFHMPPGPFAPDVAIPVMKHALECGARFWSAAEFYGTADYNSLHLLAAYFNQYPEDAERVIISVKVGMTPGTMALAADAESIEKSYENCARILGGIKKIDVISCARIDPEVPVEVSVGALAKLVDEGKVGAVGMSECGAATLRRAAKVTRIAAVEVEFSMFTPDILTNGVAEVASEIGATIIAYSPLGKGLLTGSVAGRESLAENDVRRHWPRFQQEALENNLKLVEEVDKVTKRIGGGATKGQVALAWTRTYSGRKGMPQILPVPGTTSIKRLDENMKEVTLSNEDIKELDEIVRKNPAMGDRYTANFQSLNWG